MNFIIFLIRCINLLRVYLWPLTNNDLTISYNSSYYPYFIKDFNYRNSILRIIKGLTSATPRKFLSFIPYFYYRFRNIIYVSMGESSKYVTITELNQVSSYMNYYTYSLESDDFFLQRIDAIGGRLLKRENYDLIEDYSIIHDALEYTKEVPRLKTYFCEKQRRLTKIEIELHDEKRTLTQDDGYNWVWAKMEANRQLAEYLEVIVHIQYHMVNELITYLTEKHISKSSDFYRFIMSMSQGMLFVDGLVEPLVFKTVTNPTKLQNISWIFYLKNNFIVNQPFQMQRLKNFSARRNLSDEGFHINDDPYFQIMTLYMEMVSDFIKDFKYTTEEFSPLLHELNNYFPVGFSRSVIPSLLLDYASNVIAHGMIHNTIEKWERSLYYKATIRWTELPSPSMNITSIDELLSKMQIPKRYSQPTPHQSEAIFTNLSAYGFDSTKIMKDLEIITQKIRKISKIPDVCIPANISDATNT